MPERSRRPGNAIHDIARSQGIAVVFDEPKMVLPTERDDPSHIEGVPQRMRDHDRLRSGGQGLFQPGTIQIIGGKRDVHENGNRSVLNDGCHGCGKRRSDGDDLIPGANPSFSEQRRGEGHESEKVCRGS
jgi:hypothetical protein